MNDKPSLKCPFCQVIGKNRMIRMFIIKDIKGYEYQCLECTNTFETNDNGSITKAESHGYF